MPRAIIKHKVHKKRKTKQEIIESVSKFMTEVPKNKKVVGGKRTTDAVTGPPHQEKKPKRLEPTIAKVAKGVSRAARNFRKRGVKSRRRQR